RIMGVAAAGDGITISSVPSAPSFAASVARTIRPALLPSHASESEGHPHPLHTPSLRHPRPLRGARAPVGGRPLHPPPKAPLPGRSGIGLKACPEDAGARGQARWASRKDARAMAALWASSRAL